MKIKFENESTNDLIGLHEYPKLQEGSYRLSDGREIERDIEIEFLRMHTE